jgi:hypothetical protein
MSIQPRTGVSSSPGQRAIPGTILLGTVACAIWWGFGSAAGDSSRSALLWCVLLLLMGQWITWGLLVAPTRRLWPGASSSPLRSRAMFAVGASHMVLGLLNAWSPLLEFGKFGGSGRIQRWNWTISLLLLGVFGVISAWRARRSVARNA